MTSGLFLCQNDLFSTSGKAGNCAEIEVQVHSIKSGCASLRVPSRSLSRQFHAHAVKSAAAPVLGLAPADHGQTAVLAVQARLIGVRSELNLDGITGREGIIHFKHQPGITIVYKPRRDDFAIGKAFGDRAPCQGRTARGYPFVTRFRESIFFQMKHYQYSLFTKDT